MLPFYIGLVIIVLGLGSISFLLFKEKKQETAASEKKEEETPLPQKEKLNISDLLTRLGFKPKTQKQDIAAEKKRFPLPFNLLKVFKKKFDDRSTSADDNSKSGEGKPSFFSHLKKNPFKKKAVAPETGTASLRLDVTAPPPPPAEKDIAVESELSLQHDELQTQQKELQEKYAKLESLFQEKSAGHEKSEKALSNELKNRKEFNKIKDILEKELKDSRDSSRNLHVKVNDAQTESQSYIKRIHQLEEMMKEREKEIRTKEEEAKTDQCEIQKAQSRIMELTEKIQKNEESLQEKDKKIEDLVNRLKAGAPVEQKAPDEPPLETPKPEEEGLEEKPSENKPAGQEASLPTLQPGPADKSTEVEPVAEKVAESDESPPEIPVSEKEYGFSNLLEEPAEALEAGQPPPPKHIVSDDSGENLSEEQKDETDMKSDSSEQSSKEETPNKENTVGKKGESNIAATPKLPADVVQENKESLENKTDQESEPKNTGTQDTQNQESLPKPEEKSIIPDEEKNEGSSGG